MALHVLITNIQLKVAEGDPDPERTEVFADLFFYGTGIASTTPLQTNKSAVSSFSAAQWNRALVAAAKEAALGQGYGELSEQNILMVPLSQ